MSRNNLYSDMNAAAFVIPVDNDDGYDPDIPELACRYDSDID